MTTPYTRLIDEREVTAESIEEDREACRASDQAKELTPGSQTWGIIYTGGQRGQMSRYPNGRGAIAMGGESVWGDWVTPITPDGDHGADMLAADSGEFFGEHGTPLCKHGFALGADEYRTCDCVEPRG